jgi:hypothetical protein
MFCELSVSLCHVSVRCYLLNQERALPIVYFYSDTEAQVNMHCCYHRWVGERDCGNNPVCPKSSELICQMFLSAGKFIRNQEFPNI